MSAHSHTASWVRARNFHPGHLNFRPCDLSVSPAPSVMLSQELASLNICQMLNEA